MTRLKTRITKLFNIEHPIVLPGSDLLAFNVGNENDDDDDHG